jgi:hypothetical protein
MKYDSRTVLDVLEFAVAMIRVGGKLRIPRIRFLGTILYGVTLGCRRSAELYFEGLQQISWQWMSTSATDKSALALAPLRFKDLEIIVHDDRVTLRLNRV